jgi:hypothetical protein
VTLKTTGQAATAVFAGQNNTTNIASSVAVDVAPVRSRMHSTNMADVFKDRLDSSYSNTKRGFEKQVEVPADQKFIGFDGYKKAMDCLKPGDVVIFATPPSPSAGPILPTPSRRG